MNQKVFILSDILNILEDSLNAFNSIPAALEFYPLAEYFLQSVFLKMTGYQEQKCKSILWNIASVDMDARYKMMSTSELNINEASKLVDKLKVYNQIIKSAQTLDIPLTLPDDKEKSAMISDVKDRMVTMLNTAVLGVWRPRDLKHFDNFSKELMANSSQYITKDGIFQGDNMFKSAAENTWRHRNRCAHNLLSYQSNVPSLKEMIDDKYGANNYFSRMFVLALIDRALVELYSRFLKFSA